MLECQQSTEGLQAGVQMPTSGETWALGSIHVRNQKALEARIRRGPSDRFGAERRQGRAGGTSAVFGPRRCATSVISLPSVTSVPQTRACGPKSGALRPLAGVSP